MDFEQIEDKLIETLKSIPYLKTVETYAGQLEAEIESLPIRFPACYVVYGGSNFDWLDGPNHQETVDFTVLVAGKNLRGSSSLRKDSGGAYDLINDVTATLTNKNFDLDIERLKPMKVALVFISKTVAVYGIDFQTSFDGTYDW
ncbi:MAG: DUF1834 family protein [Nitrospirae bacterium]|nr:DUF1834 family protein [Nitrospirota bacterium]